MKNKIFITAITAALSSSLMHTSVNSNPMSADVDLIPPTKTSTLSLESNINKPQLNKIKLENDLDNNVYTYIVRLKDLPIATYDGSIPGLAATSPKIAKKSLFKSVVNSKQNSFNIRNSLKIDFNSNEVTAYKQHLIEKQQLFLNKSQQTLGIQAPIVRQYHNAFNGIALKLTQQQAHRLSKLDDVAFIEREKMEHLDTDTGPIHIGATQVWQGEGQTATNMGEGVIIGVIDTGINTDHPSFADVGGDGYDHTNPWGTGVYVGDCAGDFPELCNDKLIGVRSYSFITDIYDDADVFGETPPAKNGEDYNGHGSHTASTSGGNILVNVPLVSPEAGVEESDGIVNENFSFERISGVAPHANIISYQICAPGNRGDTYAGCAGSAILAALDDAIADGVDVINYSISGGGNPWQSATELSFLAAQEAGIFAAVSAGNDGPNAFTTDKSAPWYTAVGASTHGRTLDAYVKFNGESYIFTEGTGPKLTATISATAISAADIDADNVEGCNAFADSAFNDAIALISRGTCAFADKVTHAAAAGASAVIVYNNRDGNSRTVMGSLEDTSIPAVMISQNDGATLLADLTENSDLALMIDPSLTLNIGQADDMADFSSRGPNSFVNNIMTPSVTAPGVSIYAAYSDQQYGHDGNSPSPSDYAFLQGTSMSSPHTAGAGAVLKSAHPTWTPDNIRSALMLTASSDVRKEDGATPADVFDMGSGSIRVNLATNTGLIMDETFANYMRANPDVDGKPETLNIPSMTNIKCVDTCSWTRTFTATKDASWSVMANSSSESMTLSVSPSSFEINAGETQTITVTADVSDATVGVWNFGKVILSSEGSPDAKLPVLAQISGDNLPTQLNIETNRANGSITYKDLQAKSLSNILPTVYEPQVVAEATLAVPDGSYDLTAINFSENIPLAVFTSESTEAPDSDLVIYDANFSVIGVSAGPTSSEKVTLSNLAAGTYYIVVWAYTPSAEGATDSVDIAVSLVEFAEDYLSEDIAVTIDESVASNNPNINSDTNQAANFDLTLNWRNNSQASGIILLSGDNDASQTIPFSLSAGEPDVTMMVSEQLMAESSEIMPGTSQGVSYSIAPNFTNDDKTYHLTATISAGHEVANVSHNGIVDGDNISWTITRAVGQSSESLTVGFDLIPRASGTENTLTLTNTLNGDSVETSYNFGVVNVAPVAQISAANAITEGANVTLSAINSSDANNDNLTYQWTQTSGDPVNFSADTVTTSFIAPSYDKTNNTLSFQLTVDDGHGNTHTTTTTLTIKKKPSTGGGSFGWILLLMPLVLMRRTKV